MCKRIVVNKLICGFELIGYRVDLLKEDLNEIDFCINVPNKLIIKFLKVIPKENIVPGHIITTYEKDGDYLLDSCEPDMLKVKDELQVNDILNKYFSGTNFLNSDKDVITILGSVNETVDESYNKDIEGIIEPLNSLVSGCEYIKSCYNNILKSIEGKKVDLSVIMDTEEEDLAEYEDDDCFDVKFNLNLENIEDSLNVILDNIKMDGTDSVKCQLSCSEGNFVFNIDMSMSNEDIINTIKKQIGSFDDIDGFIRDWYIVHDGVYIVSIDETITKEML